MTGYLSTRLLQTGPTLFGILILVFLMLRLLPGDPAAFIAGDNVGAEALANLRHTLGLDQPLIVQFATYLGKVLSGDLGQSVVTGTPVLSLVASALPVTVLVGGLSLVLSFVLAVPLGALAAYLGSKGKGHLDQALTIALLVIDVVPSFWLALIFMLIFTLHFGLFPSTGPVGLDDPRALGLRLILPVAVLTVGQLASIARVTRSAVAEILQEDYIRTARALGTPDWSILFGHALRNAALPIVTMAGLSFGRLLGGTVLIETVFAIPGMGTVLINGIFSRDYPVVQGVILLYALMFVLVNVATDVLYTRADPRVRL